jgi:hypothetical protein
VGKMKLNMMNLTETVTKNARFEVFTAVKIQVEAFWVDTM